ncbi:MAG: hypothetical protein JWP26_3136 [Devosia sp.]|uniref:DUF5107 domain-containing protein n=1 Tax=Devosia sp. TaxID=1871048 RepID=UPI0026247D4C|nr:DUF5107 domain-containing protein [Devosia sp.]MDB5588166.1 hypothetical protein [Devosia sp.]
MTTSIHAETLTLPASRLGQPSNVPRFRWQQPIPDNETPPHFGLSADESSHGFQWGKDSILPYQVSDDYDRDLKPGTLEVLVIENARLRAVVAPTLGGRLLELKDLSTGRDLVFSNPVLQPANLAALNAWFSGGIEWNGLIPGHTPFTCAPVFAGVRETSRGPVLRLYEFDRIVEATWQIDLFLPEDSDVLFAHGRIVNPSDTARLAYWWTNVAVPMTPGTRVLSPADYSIEHIWPGNNLGRCDFPREDWDASYPQNWENATSVFFRAPSAPRLFIASIDRHGYGLAQCSTREMPGRKFFYFGSGAGGQNWMDYLSRPGEGNYLEIQSGMTPTQNQRFELAAHEEREWTEAFMPLQLDATAHDPDYRAATAHAANAIELAIPAHELAQVHAFLAEQARLPLDVRHSAGERWGAREERLIGKPLAAGLDFSVDGANDFWDDLASGAAIAASNLRDMPVGVALSPRWIERIKANAPTWVGELTLATAALDRNDRQAASEHVAQSLALKPSWAAHRIEALLATTPVDASSSYLRAWNASDAPPELAVEIAQYFVTMRLSGELKAFVDGLPAHIRSNERIILARAAVAANDGDFDELERLLFDRPFATIREGETLLSDLWVRLRRGRIEAQLKRPASVDEVKADLKAHPVPRALNLRMHAIDET